jgi:hypothetical protein
VIGVCERGPYGLFVIGELRQVLIASRLFVTAPAVADFDEQKFAKERGSFLARRCAEIVCDPGPPPRSPDIFELLTSLIDLSEGGQRQRSGIHTRLFAHGRSSR